MIEGQERAGGNGQQNTVFPSIRPSGEQSPRCKPPALWRIISRVAATGISVPAGSLAAGFRDCVPASRPLRAPNPPWFPALVAGGRIDGGGNNPHHQQDEARMIDKLAQWPEWWEWQLELTPHLLKRMADRQFNEVDLRTMLAVATHCESEPDGRFIIYSEWGGRHWEVVVEPDYTDRVLLVITAYARD